MKMIKRLIRAYKKLKEEDSLSGKEKIANEFLYDPLSLELIGKMARDCGGWFEIIRPSDGFIFRYYKDGVKVMNAIQDYEEYR
jgi:hypothetical protein